MPLSVFRVHRQICNFYLPGPLYGVISARSFNEYHRDAAAVIVTLRTCELAYDPCAFRFRKHNVVPSAAHKSVPHDSVREVVEILALHLHVLIVVISFGVTKQILHSCTSPSYRRHRAVCGSARLIPAIRRCCYIISYFLYQVNSFFYTKFAKLHIF